MTHSAFERDRLLTELSDRVEEHPVPTWSAELLSTVLAAIDLAYATPATPDPMVKPHLKVVQ